MEFFETKLLQNILPNEARWLWCVDAILCLWVISLDLDTSLLRLGSLVPSIKFTVEREVDCKLPFLDVLIHCVDRNFKFTVYRKITNDCSSITTTVMKPEYKGVSLTMFLRAFRVCNPAFLEDSDSS